MPHTLVTFHAHPDDEAIATAGVMAKAAAEGHRVVLVVATRGEHAGFGHEMLEPGETMSERRVQETRRAAEILGVSRVEFLGYVDSGMMGTPENDANGSFWTADVDEAAERLAKVLDEEEAEVLTVYDDHGGYGHPDHIQVHRVGVRAAELARTPLVYESTINRDHIRRLLEQAIAGGNAELPGGLDPDDLPDPDDTTFGSPESIITTVVDVRDYVDRKREAMVAHASQIAESHFFLKLPPDVFREGFGFESFIRRGAPDGARDTDLFAPLS
ncbi:MAG TPA: PIG-L family deacetylase [Acidimicrobiia bacterium]|nr:PIG-L family deacetylase [Acidimicrobiia bacterium]